MNEPVDLSKFETIRDAYLNVIENYIPLYENDIVDFLCPNTFDKYMAFGIKIPRQLIEESKYYILKDKNPLSDTVKRYPYIQLIVAFWMFNKLYELDKHYNFFQEKYSNIDGFQKMLSQYIYDSLYPFDIYGNPAKELRFLDSNQYKLYDIYYVCNQIKKLGGQSFNVKGNNKIMLYSAYDYATVMQYDKFEYFSLYDLIYDGLLSMIATVFLELGDNSKKFFKINQADFKYEEYQFKALYGTLKGIYKEADDKIIKLVCNKPLLTADNSLIVKSKYNEYYNKTTYTGVAFENAQPSQGIVYDETYELTVREIKRAQANNKGQLELYKYDFKECALNLCPPYKGYRAGMPDGSELYTYKEYEQETGHKFYASHNFFSITHAFHLHRYMRYAWSADMGYGYNENVLLNKIYAYLYRKCTTFQMMCLMHINSYCR